MQFLRCMEKLTDPLVFKNTVLSELVDTLHVGVVEKIVDTKHKYLPLSGHINLRFA